jgi:hypothetical protein
LAKIDTLNQTIDRGFHASRCARKHG